MTADYVEAEVNGKGFLGFKPYRTYSVTGDAADAASPISCPGTRSRWPIGAGLSS